MVIGSKHLLNKINGDDNVEKQNKKSKTYKDIMTLVIISIIMIIISLKTGILEPLINHLAFPSLSLNFPIFKMIGIL